MMGGRFCCIADVWVYRRVRRCIHKCIEEEYDDGDIYTRINVCMVCCVLSKIDSGKMREI